MDVRTPGNKAIAKKFGISLSKVKAQVKVGAKHEKEHNTNTKKAEEVARDHLGERPDYYKQLRKMEKKKVELNELDTKTKLSYVNKAHKQIASKDVDQDTKYKRTIGLNRAARSMTQKNLKEETSNLISEAIQNVIDNDLIAMKENFQNVLYDKAIDKLEEKKKEIASNYFGA